MEKIMQNNGAQKLTPKQVEYLNNRIEQLQKEIKTGIDNEN